MIEKFYTDEANVKRLTYTDNKSSYSSVGLVSGHLQQASAYVIAQTASIYTLSHLFWCGVDEDIAVNDNVVIDGAEYSINGIQRNAYGKNDHLECHIERL